MPTNINYISIIENTNTQDSFIFHVVYNNTLFV